MTETAIGALFDVDGTLVDSNYLHAVTWWQAFTHAGHDVPMAAIHEPATRAAISKTWPRR